MHVLESVAQVSTCALISLERRDSPTTRDEMRGVPRVVRARPAGDQPDDCRAPSRALDRLLYVLT